MSLLGVKWLGHNAILCESHTLDAPLILRNSVMATAADSSLAMTRSRSIEMMSLGATSALPACAARIFSVRVIGRAMRDPPGVGWALMFLRAGEWRLYPRSRSRDYTLPKNDVTSKNMLD